MATDKEPLPIPAEYASEDNKTHPSLYTCTNNLPDPTIYPGAGPNGTDLVIPVEISTVTIQVDYELHTFNSINENIIYTLEVLQSVMLTYLAEAFGIGLVNCSGNNVTEGIVEPGGNTTNNPTPVQDITTIISIGSMPMDMLDQFHACDPSLDPGIPSTTCTAINGYYTTSYLGTDESAVTRILTHRIKKAMNVNSNNPLNFTAVSDNLAALSFIGRRNGGFGGDSIANPVIRGYNPPPPTSGEYLTATGTGVVVGASALCTILALLFCRWRRRRVQEEKMYQEEYGNALKSQPALDESFYGGKRRGLGSIYRGSKRASGVTAHDVSHDDEDDIGGGGSDFHKSKEFYANEGLEYGAENDTWSTQEEEIMEAQQQEEEEEIIRQQERDGKLAPQAPGEELRSYDHDLELLRKEALMGISQGFMIDHDDEAAASSSAMSSADTDRICTFQAEPQSIYSLSGYDDTVHHQVTKVPLYPPLDRDDISESVERKDAALSPNEKRRKEAQKSHSERMQAPISHSIRHHGNDNPLSSPSERETNEQISRSARNEVLSEEKRRKREGASSSSSPSKREARSNSAVAKEKPVVNKFYLNEKLNDANNQEHAHHHHRHSERKSLKYKPNENHKERPLSPKREKYQPPRRTQQEKNHNEGREKSYVGRKFYLNESLNVST